MRPSAFDLLMKRTKKSNKRKNRDVVDSTWTCTACTLKNDDAKHRCEVCGTHRSRTEEKMSAREWQCDACTLLNPFNALRCAACSHPRDREAKSPKYAIATNKTTQEYNRTNSRDATSSVPAPNTSESAFSQLMKASRGRGMHFHLKFVGSVTKNGSKFEWTWEDYSTRAAAKKRGAASAGDRGWCDDSLTLKACDDDVWMIDKALRGAGSDMLLVVSTNLSSPPSSSSSSSVAAAAATSSVAQQRPGSTCTLPLSVIKSSVQKAVRRRKVRHATKGVAELIRRGTTTIGGKDAFLEVVRRLIIIAGEDSVQAHPHLPVLAWLVVAMSKGFRPAASHVECVLQIARDLAACRYRELVRYDAKPLQMCVKCSRFHISKGARTLVRSVLLRKRFGGMRCDMKMLAALAADWALRFSSSSCDGVSDFSVWESDLLRLFRPVSDANSKQDDTFVSGSLSERDILAEGVDFHCCPKMIDEIVRCAGVDAVSKALQSEKRISREDVCDRIRSAMWLFRSSTNVKRCIRVHPLRSGGIRISDETEGDEEADEKVALKPAWDLVRAQADRYAERLIRKGFRNESTF